MHLQLHLTNRYFAGKKTTSIIQMLDKIDNAVDLLAHQDDTVSPWFGILNLCLFEAYNLIQPKWLLLLVFSNKIY